MNKGLWYRHFGFPEETLSLESTQLSPLEADSLRIKMLLSPVNASDLIPITGAYRHRIPLPNIAGYEGVGEVTEANEEAKHLIGKRVLPLRGEGTWQQFLSCKVDLVIPVPDEIDDALASRAYINPVAAMLMLNLYNITGKRILITASGSECAKLIGQWALWRGATEVISICRSHIHVSGLAKCGFIPVMQYDSAQIRKHALAADIVYDATGGNLAEYILESMKKESFFVSYGLLSGQPFIIKRHYPKIYWFHIRNYIDKMDITQWQSLFTDIWPLLKLSQRSEISIFPLTHWKEAITFYRSPGRNVKPVLKMEI